MNTSQAFEGHPGIGTWARRLWAPLLVVLLLSWGVISVTGYFRLSSDLRGLRDGLMASDGPRSGAWNKKIELRVGWLSCYVVRAGLSLLPLDPDAQTVLQAARGFEVGVYQLSQGADWRTCAGRNCLLKAADDAMAKRGWDRLVGVSQERELVVVYVPKEQSRLRNVRACVGVINGGQLVLAGVRSNLEPLLELVQKHPDWTALKWNQRGEHRAVHSASTRQKRSVEPEKDWGSRRDCPNPENWKTSEPEA
jgi:hypothetical protein